MSVGISIDVRDNLSPLMARLRAGMEAPQLKQTIGEAGVRAYKRHFTDLDRARPNRLKGARTHYYRKAGAGTSYQEVDGGVVIAINQIGIAQRYFGGTIRPKQKKFLTIPVHPAAHGKTAREFDLEVVFGAGGRPIALATKPTLAREFTQNKRGQIRARNIGRRGEIYFLLLKSVTQQPDPSVLLLPDQLAGQILPEARRYLERIIERGGPSA